MKASGRTNPKQQTGYYKPHTYYGYLPVCSANVIEVAVLSCSLAPAPGIISTQRTNKWKHVYIFALSERKTCLQHFHVEVFVIRLLCPFFLFGFFVLSFSPLICRPGPASSFYPTSFIIHPSHFLPFALYLTPPRGERNELIVSVGRRRT